MNDHEIIALYFARDEQAIRVTDETYGHMLTRLAENMVGKEDGEECVNDTYLTAWNRIPPLHPLHFCAWLSKVCRNLALNRLEWHQAQKRNAPLVQLSDELQQCLPDRIHELHQEGEEIGRALSAYLKGLPLDKRALFLRRYWFGDDIHSLSLRFGYSESKVKTTLFRIRRNLKDYLEKEEIFI